MKEIVQSRGRRRRRRPEFFFFFVAKSINFISSLICNIFILSAVGYFVKGYVRSPKTKNKVLVGRLNNLERINF